MNIFRSSVLRLAAVFCRISAIIAGVLILLTALIVTYEVLLRAAFDAPTEWVNEISVYLISISAFLSFAPALASGKHIAVDLVTSKLPAHINRFLGYFVSVLGLFFSVVLLVTSWEMTLNAYRLNMLSTSTLRIPLFIVQSAIPIGSFNLSLQFLANLVAASPIETAAAKEDYQ